jgi:hypothetical protein
MQGLEIVGLYAVMAAAIGGGLLLLWVMLGELVHFDSRSSRARSARVLEAVMPRAIRSLSQSSGLAEPPGLLELHGPLVSSPVSHPPRRRLMRDAAR